MERISSEQPYPAERMSIFESCGSIGNSAIRRPSFVSSPRSLSAPRAYLWRKCPPPSAGFAANEASGLQPTNSCSSALISVSAGGGSMKSKWMRSLIPSDLSISTTEPRLVRWISGMVLSSSSFL